MASIPGVRFDITGASGTQGLLSPQSSWRAYIFPRGGYASQDSTGTLLTFDSASVASRFAVNNWVQAGLSTANIRQVSAVGGNSLSIFGANLTVSENDRIYLIGNTEPTITGGSATYTVPDTIIRQRDDDGAAIFINSMVTSSSDGLIQFFSDLSKYDAIIQDGNQANQGSLIDLPVGAVDGVSTELSSVFGATVTFNAGVIMGSTTTITVGTTISSAVFRSSSEPVLNVKHADYGATGDGSTDDAAAIQLALDAVGAAGRTVYIPGGSYLLGTGLTISSNTTLVMAHDALLIRNFVGTKPTGATIYNTNAAAVSGDTPTFPASPDTKIIIRGGEFQANDSADTGPHIALYGVENFAIEGCRFSSVFSDWNVALYAKFGHVSGLFIDSGVDVFEDGIHILGGENIQVSNCFVKCGDDAIAIGNNLNLPISDISVINCTVDSQEGNAIKIHQNRGGALTIDPTRFVERISVSNVNGKAGQVQNGGIAILHDAYATQTNEYRVRDVVISDCNIEMGAVADNTDGTPYVNAWGVFMQGGEDITLSNVQIISPIRSGFRMDDSHEVKLIGCRTNSPTDDSGTGRQCLDTDGVIGLVVQGCDFFNITHQVVRLDDTSNVAISGNTIRGITGSHAGVLIIGTTSTNISITGNVFDQSADDSRGVQVNNAAVDQVVITGNDFTGVSDGLQMSNTPALFTAKANVFALETATGTYTFNQWEGHAIIDSSAGAVTATQGSGLEIGDVRTIVMTDASNSSTVSVTNHETSDPEVFTFAQVDDTLVLMWTGTEWITIANSGVAT